MRTCPRPSLVRLWFVCRCNNNNNNNSHSHSNNNNNKKLDFFFFPERKSFSSLYRRRRPRTVNAPANSRQSPRQIGRDVRFDRRGAIQSVVEPEQWPYAQAEDGQEQNAVLRQADRFLSEGRRGLPAVLSTGKNKTSSTYRTFLRSTRRSFHSAIFCRLKLLGRPPPSIRWSPSRFLLRSFCATRFPPATSAHPLDVGPTIFFARLAPLCGPDFSTPVAGSSIPVDLHLLYS